MGRVPDFKRIAKEDFSGEDRQLIERLAFPINSFFEQVRSLFNKNIDFTNLNQEIITLTVRVDSDGNPLIQTRYKSNLLSRVRGHICIKAVNLDDNNSPPSSVPLVDFVQTTDIVNINKITGLDANTQYRLTILSIGD